MKPDPSLAVEILKIVEVALAEDIGAGDITAALIPDTQRSTAVITTRESAVICGRPWADEVFRQLNTEVQLTWLVEDGDDVRSGQDLVRLEGPTGALLTGERTAINFLQTLSATATASRRYSRLIEHTSVQLLDTRKTLPGLRRAQKYAVACGGCTNHRLGLYDAFLIKENHIAACGGISPAVERARTLRRDATVEVEVESLSELDEAIAARADIVMLDNFSLEDIRQAVARRPDGIKLEVSGGIESDDDLLALSATGVDFVSIGALTKHCRAIDLSMRMKG